MRHLTHRDYTRATEYENSPEQVKNRMERNRARAAMEKAGKVHKGDGKDVDHRKPLSEGGTGAKANLQVKTVHNNRSFHRNADNSVKKNTPYKR